MTWVILGAGGQLGQELTRRLPHALAWSRAEADFRTPDAWLAHLEALRPTVLLNAASDNIVDRAETDPQATFLVNTWTVRRLAQMCARLGALFVHFSSNLVFGPASSPLIPWTETDTPQPLSVYGVSKLAGECFVRAECPHHLVIRTAGVLGMRSVVPRISEGDQADNGTSGPRGANPLAPLSPALQSIIECNASLGGGEGTGVRGITIATESRSDNSSATLAPHPHPLSPAPIRVDHLTPLAGRGRGEQAGLTSAPWNFVEKILDAARRGSALRIADDQFIAPISTHDLAAATLNLIAQGATGLYHINGRDACTWYEYARAILERSGVETSLQPITTQELNLPARRPLYSVMSNRKYIDLGFPEPNGWSENLNIYLQERSRE